MKDQLFKIIDELADKSLTFGQRVLFAPIKNKDRAGEHTIVQVEEQDGETFYTLYYGGLSNMVVHERDLQERNNERFYFKILGHPVLIGDVLSEKAKWLANEDGEYPEEQDFSNLEILVLQWKKCGITKSLQEIFDCEWEESQSTDFHVCIPIRKAIELLKDGQSPLTGTPSQQLKVLTKAESEGKEYFCGCDNQKANGKCAGHPNKPEWSLKDPAKRALAELLIQLFSNQ